MLKKPKMVKGELEQLTAGIAAMTKQGVNAANATTQLNSIVNAFIKLLAINLQTNFQCTKRLIRKSMLLLVL